MEDVAVTQLLRQLNRGLVPLSNKMTISDLVELLSAWSLGPRCFENTRFGEVERKRLVRMRYLKPGIGLTEEGREYLLYLARCLGDPNFKGLKRSVLF